MMMMNTAMNRASTSTSSRRAAGYAVRARGGGRRGMAETATGTVSVTRLSMQPQGTLTMDFSHRLEGSCSWDHVVSVCSVEFVRCVVGGTRGEPSQRPGSMCSRTAEPSPTRGPHWAGPQTRLSLDLDTFDW
ncbi:BQ5605_C007g04518 [Microbotryum silenes-dioicae]|uniref:BQ5605_C007g04518 protein n=1 Tax=Microbotryum silenes-dioicae TaxID=796604 RepID=A0A2X0P2V9_9BASI|nr:BQ5605_C007g04518 [Microbotryum silenes-dioicae]